MKILIISYYFAPTNTIASHRITALARHLDGKGHKVKVVTARHRSIPRDFAADHSGIDVVETRPLLFAGMQNRSSHMATSLRIKGAHQDWLKRFYCQRLLAMLRRTKTIARHLTVWPDKQVGWAWFALPAAWRITRRWGPDLIYASAPPATSMVVAAVVSKLTSVPWICEIRDRWADDPYYPRPQWRKAAERGLERAVLRSTKGIVTVSHTWSHAYSAQYGKPVETVYSGFDPGFYKGISTKPAAGLPLRIVYTGSIYAGRDPSPLWSALAEMGDAASGVRVEFYGARRDEVLPGAERSGVARLVHVEEHVPHERAVSLQCGADVLLMLQWNNESEAGNVPGKLFEYIGAGRPILAMGFAGAEMARLIRELNAGLFSNEPEEIKHQLNKWCYQKRIGPISHEVHRLAFQELTRSNQFDKMDAFICKCMRDSGQDLLIEPD